MAGYTKLFSSIVMSSIWDEPDQTRIVWCTLLALADQHGHVDGTIKSLALVARVPVDACERAVQALLSPDKDDRSGVDDGRRMRPEQGGWTLTNYATYRQRMSREDRQERDKLRKRNARASAARPQMSDSVRDVSQAEAEAEQKQKQKTGKSVSSALESAEPVVLTFRTSGTPPTWGLTEAQIAAWRPLYASLDVDRECGKALAWLEASRRLKTARGMPRFLVGWLNRAADRAGGPASAGSVRSSLPAWVAKAKAGLP